MVTATKTEWNKKNNPSKQEGINNTANTKGETDGKTWRRLKRVAIVVFENLLAQQLKNSYTKFILNVCNVWYNAGETYMFDKKLWFCHSQVIYHVL